MYYTLNTEMDVLYTISYDICEAENAQDEGFASRYAYRFRWII